MSDACIKDIQFTVTELSEKIRECMLSGNVGGADLWASTLKQCCEALMVLTDE